MHIELLVDSPPFWDRLRDDLSRARRSAFLQTLSFEGDRVGTALGRALEACAATDRRLLIDGYSRLVHNDRIVAGPAWMDRSFRTEVLLTRRWVGRLRRRGVAVRFGNPPGLNPLRLIRRNHKKLAVLDERIVYLGGINFCEHNFAWHDMMLRVESPELAGHLARDFLRTWSGRPRPFDLTVGPLRILGLTGRGNPERFRPVLDAIRNARRRIEVMSAYLSPPFTDELARARRRGVRVCIVTPALNNKSNLARFILEAGRKHGFRILRYPGRMNHLKAMMVDDELLVAGSSNFDSVSYHFLDELVLLTRDPGVLADFRRLVWVPDVGRSAPAPARASAGTVLGYGAIRVGAVLASALACS